MNYYFQLKYKWKYKCTYNLYDLYVVCWFWVSENIFSLSLILKMWQYTRNYIVGMWGRQRDSKAEVEAYIYFNCNAAKSLCRTSTQWCLLQVYLVHFLVSYKITSYRKYTHRLTDGWINVGLTRKLEKS